MRCFGNIILCTRRFRAPPQEREIGLCPRQKDAPSSGQDFVALFLALALRCSIFRAMPRPSPSFRLFTAALLGFASAGACGAAMPHTDKPEATSVTPGSGGEASDFAKKSKEDNGGEGKPNCPNGALEDPHRGFVRCLNPEERDAGWLPPPPQPEPDAGTDAAPPPEGPKEEKPKEPEPPKEPEKPAPPPVVTVSAPKFEGGEVPRAEKFINANLEGIGKCIAQNGGLKANKGTLKVSFLVRARGRAEGVEIATQKNVSDEAASCVRLLLKNKAVGAPSSDPVGVTVTFTLEKAK